MNRLKMKRTGWGYRGAVLAIALWAVGGFGCIQGGGTDIGNALVMGTVMDEGQAVAGAKVLLMPEGYNPVVGDATGTVRTAMADEQGRSHCGMWCLGGIPWRHSILCWSRWI